MASSRALIGCMGLLALLSSCASKNATERVETRTQLDAGTDLNPDASGRPSPVVVRIYQLRGDTEFLNSDFFALYSNEKNALGANLVARDEFVVNPGERREVRIGLSTEARNVGAVAAFRDLTGAHWRALQLRPRRTFSSGFARVTVIINMEHNALTLGLKK
jgi:type VI secretion system protein VasD